MVERESWVHALAQNREEGRGISLVFVRFVSIDFPVANQSVALAGPAIWAARQLARVGARFSFGVGVLLTGLLIPPLLARIRAEERLLRTQFGGEYDLYCTRTSRLIPTLY